MGPQELVKKILATIEDKTFSYSVYCSFGKCDGWDGETELSFTTGQILYQIKQSVGMDELFDGFALEEFDLEDYMFNAVMDAALPDGGPIANFTEIADSFLNSLIEELESIDSTDPKAVAEMRCKLNQIEDAEYLFRFDITDPEGYFYFDEGAEEKISMSADEVRGLLYSETDNKDVFDGISFVKFGEDEINDRAEETGFAADHDYNSYGGHDEPIENYFDGWCRIIRGIMSNEITEADVDDWMEYFDEEEYDWRIDDYMKDKMEDL